MSLAGLNRTCAPPEITHHSAFLTCAFCLDRVHPETPGQFPRPARFLFGKEAFFVLARKSASPDPAEGGVCGGAYIIFSFFPRVLAGGGPASGGGGGAVEIG